MTSYDPLIYPSPDNPLILGSDGHATPLTDDDKIASANGEKKPLIEKHIVNLTDKDTKPHCGAAGTIWYGVKKVAYVCLYLFLLIASFISYAAAGITVYGAKKLYDHFKDVKKIRDLAEKQKIEAVQRVLKIPIYDSVAKNMKPFDQFLSDDQVAAETMTATGLEITTANERKVRAFVKKVRELQAAIENGEDTQSLRKRFLEIANLEIYQILKTNKEPGPAVEFFQMAYVQFSGGKGPDGRDIFEEYGHELIGEIAGENNNPKDAFSCEELADIMDEQVDKADFTRNGIVATTIWTLYHPFAAMNSIKGSWFPLEYNSHEGNPDVYGHDLTLPVNHPDVPGYNPDLPVNAQEKSLEFYYGPGPTGDRLYTDVYLAFMDRMNDKGVPIFERRVNHQNMR